MFTSIELTSLTSNWAKGLEDSFNTFDQSVLTGKIKGWNSQFELVGFQGNLHT